MIATISGYKDVTPTAFIPFLRPNLKIKGLFPVVPSSVPLIAVVQVFVAAADHAVMAL